MSDKAKEPEPKIEVASEFHISGTIIITDPCYIDDKIQPTHSRGTIYGDWGCSVWAYDPSKNSQPDENAEPIGEFCADSGQVCVTAIPDDKKSELKECIEGKTHWATVIPNFDGKIQYLEYIHKAKDGEGEYDYRSLRIKGEGTKDGKPYAFITAQTSL